MHIKIITPSKAKILVSLTIIIVGFVVVAAGIIFSGKLHGYEQTWRNRGVRRECPSSGVQTQELRIKETSSIYELYDSDCKGHDLVQYRSRDLLYVGVVLVVGGVLILGFDTVRYVLFYRKSR